MSVQIQLFYKSIGRQSISKMKPLSIQKVKRILANLVIALSTIIILNIKDIKIDLAFLAKSILFVLFTLTHQALFIINAVFLIISLRQSRAKKWLCVQ